MTNQEFEQQVLAALASLGKATAEEVVKKVEENGPEESNKQLIATTHQVLTDLHKSGKIAGIEQDGSLVYSIK